MKRLLLLLGIAAALSYGTAAQAQYIYIDVNGDGVCTLTDVLTSSVTSVDIWLNTNHSQGGATVTCSDGTNPLDIGSYDLILHKAGGGSLTFGTWTNSMAGYSQLNPPTVVGNDFGVGYGSSGAFNPPGLYKLGTLAVTVTGNPILSFSTGAAGIPSPVTGFGSECAASDNPNTVTLGVDFFDNCGLPSFDAVELTTWGKIKQTYK